METNCHNNNSEGYTHTNVGQQWWLCRRRRQQNHQQRQLTNDTPPILPPTVRTSSPQGHLGRQNNMFWYTCVCVCISLGMAAAAATAITHNTAYRGDVRGGGRRRRGLGEKSDNSPTHARGSFIYCRRSSCPAFTSKAAVCKHRNIQPRFARKPAKILNGYYNLPVNGRVIH